MDPLNRINDTRRNDTVKDYTVSLYDIDSAIKYYFEEEIKPQVTDNGSLVKVPVMYGTPERWKTVRKDGYYRDKNNQIQLPLIMFRRTNFENSRDYPRHLDGNNAKIYSTFTSAYSERNQYDRFSTLTNQIKEKDVYKVIIPKYIKLSYECTIWANLSTQLNQITESINYAESSYWGKPNEFNFLSVISGFDKSVELSDGEDRMVKSSFTIDLNGYIISNSIQKQLNESSSKTFNTTKIIMSEKII